MNSGRAADVVLVIAAHGDRGGEAPNSLLLAHAGTLATSGTFQRVTAGVLKGEPSLETALSEAAADETARLMIYPLFMARGYFTETVLAERIAGAGLGDRAIILPPLGADPAVPPLLLRQAIGAACSAGWATSETRLVVAGHGSKFSRASAAATRRAALAMLSVSPFADVEIGLLEEPPFLGDVLAATGRQTVVTGFFSGDGLHAGEDVPGAIRAASANAVYAGSAGSLPEIPGIVAAAVHRASA